VAGENPRAGVAQSPQAIGRPRLLLEVVSIHGEAMIIQAVREVGDVRAEDQLPSDAHRLVAGGVSRRPQQLYRSVAEQVAVSVDELDIATIERVVALEIGVPLESRVAEDAFQTLRDTGKRRDLAAFDAREAVVVFTSLCFFPIAFQTTFLGGLGLSMGTQSERRRHSDLVVRALTQLIRPRP
jgi:hypothetical protein